MTIATTSAAPVAATARDARDQKPRRNCTHYGATTFAAPGVELQ
jgi:hypothetical protein